MSDDSDNSFSEFVKGIKPIEQDRIIAPTTNKSTKSKINLSKQQQQDNGYAADCLFSDEFDPFDDPVERNNLNFKKHDFPNNKFKVMKKADFDYQLVCDLHGLSITQARAQVSDFLLVCQQRELTRVLIIPGRGFDKLRHALNGWLRQYDKLLAFCESPPSDGGKGVIRCQLKR